MKICAVLLDGAESLHEYFFYFHWGNLEAVRWKDWKYRIHDGLETLYNLKIDISVKTELASLYPAIVVKLWEAIQKFEVEVTNNTRPAGHIENPEVLTMKVNQF